MESKEQSLKNFHLVGIVPVAGQKLDFNFPWDDSLQPIGENYLAIEKAVFDCAMAGCKSIWIVCRKEMQPLIRYRLGDYITDPHVFFTSLSFGKVVKHQEISIYYVPIHPKDVDRRDCLAWSIITGAQSSYWAARKLSKWTIPDRYFVSFPYGLFNTHLLRDIRKYVNKPRPFYITHEGKSFKDDLFLPFTFDSEDFLQCRRKFRKEETRGWKSDKSRIKAKDAYTGRYFTHGFVFEEVTTLDANTLEVPWYYDVSSWEGLKKWLSSDYLLAKPSEYVLSYHEWNPIGVDNHEEN